jgi:hypothetical protein
MNNLELLQLMTDSANDAVAATKEEFDIDLDFSIESIAHIDHIILGFLERFQTQVLEDKAVFTLCNIYGAYIGETFRKAVGGNWLFDQTNPDAPSVYIGLNDHTYAFAGICYERLVNNSDISVKEYFDKALSANKGNSLQ